MAFNSGGKKKKATKFTEIKAEVGPSALLGKLKKPEITGSTTCSVPGA